MLVVKAETRESGGRGRTSRPAKSNSCSTPLLTAGRDGSFPLGVNGSSPSSWSCSPLTSSCSMASSSSFSPSTSLSSSPPLSPSRSFTYSPKTAPPPAPPPPIVLLRPLPPTMGESGHDPNAGESAGSCPAAERRYDDRLEREGEEANVPAETCGTKSEAEEGEPPAVAPVEEAEGEGERCHGVGGVGRYCCCGGGTGGGRDWGEGAAKVCRFRVGEEEEEERPKPKDLNMFLLELVGG